MSLHLARFWQGRGGKTKPRSNPRSRPVHVRPRLEVLEDRIVPSTIEVTNTNAAGAGSLAAAVGSAHSGDTIDFAPGLTGPITVNSSLTFQAGVTNVSIVGPTSGLVTVSGGNATEVFHILAGQNITLSNLEITGGSAATSAGIDNAGRQPAEWVADPTGRRRGRPERARQRPRAVLG